MVVQNKCTKQSEFERLDENICLFLIFRKAELLPLAGTYPVYISGFASSSMKPFSYIFQICSLTFFHPQQFQLNNIVNYNIFF